MLSACATRPDAPSYKLPHGLKLSEVTVLRVRVLKEEYTGYEPACPNEVQCITMQVWSRYHAKVLEVVRGPWDDKYIDFARLEHASYVDSIKEDCFVILTKLSPVGQDKFHVQYHAFEMVSHDRGDELNIRNLVED